jgi:hypothetical protein
MPRAHQRSAKPLVVLAVALALTASGRSAGSQVATPVPRDTLPRDSLAADSLTRDSLPAVACAGERVTAIDINPARPPFKGMARFWRTAARSVGLHHVTTQPGVIAGLLQLEVGHRCTEFRRAESERVLRAQPYLASASVRAVPDSAGGVRIEVATVDEVPAIFEGRLRGASPEAITVGNGNVAGRAVSAELTGERGHAYRDGVGIRLYHYAAFNAPYIASLEAERRTLGSLVALGVARPFYTDLQRTAWRASFRDDRGYRRILRPAGDPLALGLDQTRWELGGLYRRPLLRHVGAVGLVFTGVRDTPAQEGVLITETGLAADTGVTLRGRYARFRVVRPAALAGLRVIRFETARGFNTLSALEDLPEGVQVGGLLGRSIPAWGASDLFFAGSLYAGLATPRAWLALQFEVEGRKDYDVGEWNGLIASGRLAAYRKRSARRTSIISEELSGGAGPRLPLQLTLGDRRGGIRAYRRSRLTGAWRNVVRLEERWVLAAEPRRANLGFAGFADLGTLWAGSAPYGRTVPLRGSLGASVLAAFPAGSRRVLRVDFAAPVARDGHRRSEVRFTSSNPTRYFWQEPSDVSRARTGPVPSTLFTWPAR